MKTNKIKLLLSCGALVVLGVASLQGCSSSDDSSGTAGSGGTGTGGTGTAGKGGTGTAGTSTGGKGGSGTAGTGTAGTGTAGTSTGGTSAAAGAGNEGGEPGAAGASATSQADLCDKFCADEMVTCTDTLLQYATVGDCTTACNAFALGTPEDTGGQNTLYCRIYHLSVASMSSTNATTHCPHTKADPAVGTPCHG